MHLHTLTHRALTAGLIAACGLVAAACAPRAAGQPSATAVTTTATQADHPVLFTTAAACAACHDNLTDPAGEAIGFDSLWQGSMHANAAVDPYYLATVRSEAQQNPAIKPTVEDTCSTCHLPMANRSEEAAGGGGTMFDGGPVDAGNPYHDFFRDGISCATCHQIQASTLGGPAGNSGNFLIDLTTPAGSRDLFGPFEISESSVAMMKPLGYQVKQADHLGTSEFCAVCHSLYTAPVDENGQQKDDLRFPEQVPYLEWQQSSYASGSTAQTCQDCHMPAVDGAAMISSMSTPERSPVSRHTFTGGNTIMLNLIRQNAAALESVSTDAALGASLDRTRAQLQQATAGLAVQAGPEDGSLLIQVTVTNQTGHKLPTAFPSRRAWLHVVVKDQNGTVVFESGGWDANGQISGNDNDADASTFEPHYDRITSADQVQIYEPILGDLDGAVTTEVIRAASYLKDNRLLPAGFDKATANPDTAVVGQALDDANFTGGSDQVTYQLPLPDSAAYSVQVDLMYQSIGYRWMQYISGEDSDEARSLKQMAGAAGLTPEVLTSQTVTIDSVP